MLFGLWLIVGASASTSAKAATRASPADGVVHAKAAGIKLDPGAAQAMEAAPVGSCYNDPTLAKCPPATRVAAPSSDGAGYTFSFGSPDADPVAGIASARRAPAKATSRRAGVRRARISEFAYCTGSLSNNSPYKAAGLAQMDAKNYCTSNIDQNDIYIVLSKYDLNWDSWRQINSDYFAKQTTGRWHYYSLRSDCESNSRRNWKAEIDSYANDNGTWKVGTDVETHYLDCNYP
jgi:hypothetical protein